MKHEELEMQLQGLLSLGLTENHPEYIRVKAILTELDKLPKKDWQEKAVEIASENE